MSLIENVGVALAAVNVLLALVLAGVYWKNYRAIKSPFTLGLLLFAAFLVVHNAFVVYQFTTMMMTGFDPTMLLIDEILQLAAVGALVVATLR